ncbi:MAG: hypothetical protein HOJ02_06065 [Rhodospirillaceae bacterium]|nr:hypothetical protein [Rhodospirillaceae bacterium]
MQETQEAKLKTNLSKARQESKNADSDFNDAMGKWDATPEGNDFHAQSLANSKQTAIEMGKVWKEYRDSKEYWKGEHGPLNQAIAEGKLKSNLATASRRQDDRWNKIEKRRNESFDKFAPGVREKVERSEDKLDEADLALRDFKTAIKEAEKRERARRLSLVPQMQQPQPNIPTMPQMESPQMIIRIEPAL